VYNAGNPNLVLCDYLKEIECEVGRRFKREGIYVCLWVIHVDEWQKPTQDCKAIILQFKKIYTH